MKRLITLMTKNYDRKRASGRKGILYQSIAVFLICALFIGLVPVTAEAASLSIRYGGKKINYTKAQTKITIDGKSVKMGTPGILIDNTNMVSYADVFKKGMGAETSYDSSTKKITIQLNNILVEMKSGSKKAYVNGKEKTMDVAPRSIHFYSTGKTKVYVPAGFVTEALGCKYVWSNSTLTGQITSPYVIKMDGEWIAYSGIKGKVAYNDKEINISTCPSIVKDNTALLPVSKVFKVGLGAEYSYDSTTKQIRIAQNGAEIFMTIGSCEATVNGVSKQMGTAPRVIKIKSTGKSYVMVPGEFTAVNLGYSYKWNASSAISMITKKQEIFFQHLWDGETLGVMPDVNMLTALKAQTNNMYDQLIMESRFDTLPVITQDLVNSCLYVDIDGVYNDIEAVTEIIPNGNYMTQVSWAPTETGIRFTIHIKPESGYYTIDSGNTTTLVICDSGNANTTYQMKIPMPEGLDFSMITTVDHYEKNYFTITLPGDWTGYFAANPIVYNSELVSNVTNALDAFGNTEIKVETYKLQGYRLNEGNDFIGLNIGNPAEIYQNIVVLDAGHGGTDPGTQNKDLKEKNLTLKIIYTMAEKYFNSPESPVKAYWTRKEDTAVSLTDRASFAEKVGADFFISLHMNSATNTAAKGMEVLYAKRNENYMNNADSKMIAKVYADYLIDTLGMTGRKLTTVDRPNLVVLYKNTVPAILIELGFISNSSDYKKIADKDFQEMTAQAIYNATVTIFEDYPTGR